MSAFTGSEWGRPYSLSDRNWLKQLWLDLTSVSSIQSETDVDKTLSCHKDVFINELGKLQGIKVYLHINPKSTATQTL